MKRSLSFLAFVLCASFFLPVGCNTVTKCTGHEDCSSDELCLFSQGRCAAKCDASQADTCPGDATCDQCATSSCYGCEDCAAACVEPTGGGQGGPGGW
jgi:hypothetical protein